MKIQGREARKYPSLEGMATTIHQLQNAGVPTSMKHGEDRKDCKPSCKYKNFLWQELFRDSSRWWDNRHCKPTPRYPDFKHKALRQPLWMDSLNTPPWVAEELQSRGLAGHGTPLPQSQIDAFVASLRTCTINKDLRTGTRIHDDLLQRGLLDKCSDALVTMYAKCGELGKAKALLDVHKSTDVITWTALIAGLVRDGQGKNALDCFEEMQNERILPNAVTYACILKACTTTGAVHKGKQIHDEIMRQGLLQNDIVLGSALVDMYAKCGALSMAQDVLEGLPSRSVVSWNALIAGHAQERQVQQALSCFEQMQHEGIHPDAVTYACILKACSTIVAIDKGKQIHCMIAWQELLQNNIVLGGALVDMYAKCGALSMAQCVLERLPSRDVISWSALIAGYVQEGQAEQALNCFKQMQREGILSNEVTYSSILKACASIRSIDKGREIHKMIARQGLLQNNVVLGSALVDMYAKCGVLSMAQHVHEGLSSRNVISWSALVAGYAQEAQAEQALICFEQMQNEGVFPDAMTYACILKACATIGAADKGKQIHNEIVRQGLLQDDIVLRCALVHMYARFGALSIKQGVNCFFEQVQCDGILPDAVTFTFVLNMCSHLGLVQEGQALFIRMISDYDVKPNLECYICMVDLFGRAGHLGKAVQLIQEMPSSDYSVIWLTLLGACQKWGDVNVGRWAFEQAVMLDKCEETAYILMANIYAAVGMHEEAKSIEVMRNRKAWKKPGIVSK